MANDSIPTPGFKEPLGVGWDKPMHFGAGAMSAEVTSALAKAMYEAFGKKQPKAVGILAPLFGAAIAGTLKETMDAQEPGNKFDPQDLLATIAGGLPSAGIRFTHRF